MALNNKNDATKIDALSYNPKKCCVLCQSIYHLLTIAELQLSYREILGYSLQ